LKIQEEGMEEIGKSAGSSFSKEQQQIYKEWFNLADSGLI
jgi:EH domain-containing protein 1